MRGVRLNGNGPATKGLAELNHSIRDEQKEVRKEVAGDRQGLSEEDESRMNEDAEDANRGCKELVHPQAVQQRPQQQPQGPQGSVVCWESFLPLRSLKVLLVENDDSTRHVVSALLRNCSYEVTSVSNGLEAWKILEDLTNRIDLVLTEVIMPCLSGIALLCKIMNHKTCKNIPVIMMSSNDSMGIVFKCLSKGAVDFLVKPIRKNELKNLWQHVWRKCHSSSGSGSESGIRTQKSSRSKSVEGSDNDTGSNDEDENTSIGLHVRDGSDNGSGTQSSWTKRAVEVDSPQPMSPWNQLVDPPDSTCAQVIHSRLEAFSNNWVPTTATGECQGKDDELGNVAMGKDLEIGIPRNLDLRLEDQSKKVSTALAGANKEKLSRLESKKDGEKLERSKLELNGETSNGKVRKEVTDLMVAITNCTNPEMENLSSEVPNDISKTKIKDKAIYDTKEIPSLELSLKRLRDLGENGTSAQERNILRHSDLSAFSRYNNTTSTTNQAPTGNVGSCSPVENSSEAAKTEQMQNLQSNSNGTPNQRSNGGSNNNDMGSTTNNAFTKPAAFTDKTMPKSAVNIHPCSAFQSVQNSHESSLQSVIPGKADAAAVNKVMTQSRGVHPQVQVQHHHHHYHHHHHHVHNMQQQQQQLPNNEDSSMRTIVAAAPHCGPSNVLNTPIEGNAANYSFNGSASGSNNGSNGQNGNSAALITEGTNMESDNGVADKCGPGGGGSGYGSGSGSGVDQSRFTPREAALNKFRQKRKERCFEKKVRYQSRKRLAEQRPRVRGQFVRQVVHGNKGNDKDFSPDPSA